MAIPTAVKLQIRQRASFLCEYCHSSEEISPARFEIDHIQPKSIGGSDDIDNLALACQRCNSHHYNFIQGKSNIKCRKSISSSSSSMERSFYLE
jgi:5-methylcytosine-specific restriction endonuclease McrA